MEVEVTTSDLLTIIGQKEVEIAVLKAQKDALSRQLEELQKPGEKKESPKPLKKDN